MALKRLAMASSPCECRNTRRSVSGYVSANVIQFGSVGNPLSPPRLRERPRRKARVRADGVRRSGFALTSPHPTLSRKRERGTPPPASVKGKNLFGVFRKQLGERSAGIGRTHENLADEKRLDAFRAKSRDIVRRANAA